MTTTPSRHAARPVVAVTLAAITIAIASSGCAASADPAADGPAQASAALSAHRDALDPKHVEGDERIRTEAARAPAPPHDAKPTAETPKAIWLPFYRPDLTVVRDDRSAWHWDGSQWYPAYATGFTVSNIGSATSDSFHVAILNGSRSRGFDIPSLTPGASQYYELTSELSCGTTATVIVNPFNVAWESNYDNNVATVPGICNL
ncbi:MAG: hypothetical protein NVSMB47_20960 [Polyangiales bacterium]